MKIRFAKEVKLGENSGAHIMLDHASWARPAESGWPGPQPREPPALYATQKLAAKEIHITQCKNDEYAT